MNKKTIFSLTAIVFFVAGFLIYFAGRPQTEVRAAGTLSRLTISADRHHLVKSDGSPFFWLGDTAWALHKLSISDADFYLTDREQKGFNVIQMIFDWSPNANGDYPYINNNTDTPNEAFWQYADQLVSLAEQHGFYVVIAPMWGPVYNTLFSGDTAKAYRAGLALGNRYKTRNNVLWIVSGEYDHIGFQMPITSAQKALFNSMAQGIRDGHANTQLMTIHPDAAYTSSFEFHNESWLSFNMLQSGHTIDLEAQGNAENYALITNDYNLSPTKPVVDGEPIYEDVPDGISDPNAMRAASDVVRRKAYWAVLAGAMGHTYGHNDVWAFWSPGETAGSNQRTDWKISLNAEGAGQMGYLRNLIEARPFLNLIPDQSILASGAGTGKSHIQAAREANGAYALIYVPTGNPFQLNMAKIANANVQASWFNPRNGAVSSIGQFPNSGIVNFTPPGQPALGNDWVLIVEGQDGAVSSTCTNQFNSTLAVPTNFGASFNWFSNAKELLMNVVCSGSTATANIGNGSNTQYIYKTGYIWQNNQWTSFNYSGSSMDAGGNWFIGSANHSLGTLDLTQKQSVLSYICDWNGTKWNCGCHDSSCATGYWNLQQFKQ